MRSIIMLMVEDLVAHILTPTSLINMRSIMIMMIISIIPIAINMKSIMIIISIIPIITKMRRVMTTTMTIIIIPIAILMRSIMKTTTATGTTMAIITILIINPQKVRSRSITTLTITWKGSSFMF